MQLLVLLQRVYRYLPVLAFLVGLVALLAHAPTARADEKTDLEFLEDSKLSLDLKSDNNETIVTSTIYLRNNTAKAGFKRV